MLIGVDLDEVLAGFVPALCEYYNNKYKTSLNSKDFISYSFWYVWGGTKEKAVEEVLNFWQSYHDTIKPVPGSVESIKKLKENHELVIITSRQDEYCKNITEKWVKTYFENCFSNIYYAFNHWIGLEKKKTKSEICLDLKVDLLIDDGVEYARQCSEKGIRVLLLDCPWNQCDELPEIVTRVENWEEIVDIINRHKA